MSTRPYSLGKRKVTSKKIREKIVSAAREILMSGNGLTEFSMENVAEKAGVTRLTLYNRFGSKTGLLEEVYDDIGRRGDIAAGLAAAFQISDPEECLDALIDAFVLFWDAE